MLQSIWGFSNGFAWGLATTNPCADSIYIRLIKDYIRMSPSKGDMLLLSEDVGNVNNVAY